MIVTKDLYNRPEDCCGCEACVDICPKEIIKMESADDGFLYPIAINPEKCIDCRRCIKVCPLKSEYNGEKALYHLGGHYDNDTRIKESASGGLATAISESFVRRGGIVYGVGYSSDFKIAHYYRCDSLEQLLKLRGSVYSQPCINDVYTQVRNDLNAGMEVLFIGLPCVVSALKKSVASKQTKLYIASLICHGPTSPLVLKEYVETLNKRFGSSLTYLSLRDKPLGWKPYFIKGIFKNGFTFTEEFHPSTFGIAFRELKRQSCSECRFKLTYTESHVESDIIIGDFHGATTGFPLYNKWGVSQCSILTEKGRELLNDLDSFSLTEITPRQAIHYNKALDRIIKPRWNRGQFAATLHKQGLSAACRLKTITLIDDYNRVIGKIKSFLAKLKKSVLS